MGGQTLSIEEISRRGEEIYERELRERVEPGNRGRFLVLDVQSGTYELGDDDLAATQRLLDRIPEAVPYGIRIGHPAAYRIGGGAMRRNTR
jgi:hypothetical protein